MRFWQQLHDDNHGLVEDIPARRVRGAIVLASALALYLELVMIRWHATSSHVFAIFKNVSLLSCFLGLGIGFALSKKVQRISLSTLFPLLAVQAVLFSLIATTIGGRRVNPVAEQLVMGLEASDWSVLHLLEGNVTLVGIYLLNAVMFVPVGYLVGRIMSRLPAIESYSLNLVGSLLGILLFFVLSLMWAPPVLWFGVALLLACPFIWGTRPMQGAALASAVVMLVALGMIGRLEERRYYSPYQVITLRLPKVDSAAAEPTIKVNSAFYQAIQNCSDLACRMNPVSKDAAAYYNFPYRLQTQPGDVLVVGAGSGNDVAAALRNGAQTVTAVEIDPAIAYLGRRLHPERPYQDARTNVIVTDARTYLRGATAQFDTIVYGLLDSHTNMGAMTNVRLDSFVYTLEGFQEAVARLRSDGLLVVTYQTLHAGQAAKMYKMLEQAYPAARPRVFTTHGGTTYLTGPGLAKITTVPPGAEEVTPSIAADAAQAEVATDDWPYFYMQARTYPLSYALIILLLLAASAWMVKRRLGSIGARDVRSGAFFFLGAGFMLLETKIITELGLTFGNTWMVNAVAITGVLVMGFLANQWILRRGPVPYAWTFGLLGLTLLAGLFAGSVPLGKLLAPIVLCAPLFFAGLIFSSLLAQGEGIADALSANLFGAMLGGFLEYNSMYWGLSSLYPLGLAIYACAFVCLLRIGKGSAAAATPTSQPGAASIRRAA
jgi:hypothetical protein